MKKIAFPKSKFQNPEIKISWNKSETFNEFFRDIMNLPFYKALVFTITYGWYFYDGDISQLSGIDMKTGRIDDTITITGEKKGSNTTSTAYPGCGLSNII